MVKSSKITLQQMKSFLRMFFLKRLSDLFEEAQEKQLSITYFQEILKKMKRDYHLIKKFNESYSIST